VSQEPTQPSRFSYECSRFDDEIRRLKRPSRNQPPTVFIFSQSFSFIRRLFIYLCTQTAPAQKPTYFPRKVQGRRTRVVLRRRENPATRREDTSAARDQFLDGRLGVMSHIMNSDIPTIVSAPANTTVSRNRPASSAAARSVSGRAPIRTQSGTSQRPGGSMSGRSWSAASSRSVASSTGSTRPVHVWSRGMKAPLRPGSAAFARPDTAGPDRERRAVDPGRIRPRSAMARHSMGVDGGADDMRSVASTKVPPAVLRPSSPEDLDGYVMEDRVEDASDADFENEMLREEEGEEEIEEEVSVHQTPEKD